MSTIYRNTVIGLGLNVVYALINKAAINNALPAIAVASVIDMALNKGYSQKELISPKKVFFSPTQENMGNCSLKQKEFNYIDTGAKVLAIGLVTVDYLTNFKYDQYLSLVPACSAFVAEKIADLYEWDYKTVEMKCTDTYGMYIELEL